MSTFEEEELRAHIDDLLLLYVRTHITTDYIAYTHNETARLLGASLHFVPATDATAIALEPPVPKVVSNHFGLSGREEYTETWDKDESIARFIKQTIWTRGIPPSDRVWFEQDTAVLNRPSSPILTMKAIRQTPRPGQHRLAEPVRPLGVYVKRYDIRKIVDEVVEEPSVDTNDTLCNRLLFDQETFRATNKLVKEIAGPRTAEAAVIAGPIHDFLRQDSPAREITEVMEVPLFPRNDGIVDTRDQLKSSKAPGAATLRDLSSLLSKAPNMDELEDDLHKQQMAVLNGCDTFGLSSPVGASTPSLVPASSEQPEVDEFLLDSPPGNLFIRDLLDARMDDIQFPRSEKIGGSVADSRKPGEGQSLAAFLETFHVLQPCEPHIATSPKSLPSSPRPSMITSLLGQFGGRSLLNEASTQDFNAPDPSLPDNELEKLLKSFIDESVLTDDPAAFILNEKLDDKESLLMDVPHLALPPWSKRSVVPDKLSRFLLPRSANTRDKTHVGTTQDVAPSSDCLVPRFLKKVKGLKAFQDDLEWRPFDFGEREPTNEEVSCTDNDIQDDCLKYLKEDDHTASDHATILASLLASVSLDQKHSHEPSELMWTTDDPASCGIRTVHDDDYVLTAAERRRLYGEPDPLPDEPSDAAEDLGSPPLKRIKTAEVHTIPVVDDDSASPHGLIRSVRFEESAYIPSHLGPQGMEDFDDSGVYLADCNEPGRHEAGESHFDATFGGLSYSAEGYLGMDDDGDVIPDIDPLHASRGDYSPPLFAAWPSTRHSVPAPEPSFLEPPAKVPDAVEMHPQNEQLHEPTALRPASRNEVDGIESSGLATSASIFPHSAKQLLVPSAVQSLRHFMNMRFGNLQPSEERSQGPLTVIDNSALVTSAELPTIDIPTDLVDKHIILPAALAHGVTGDAHRYLASLDFIQKRGLTQALRGEAVELVEREYLDGADIIVDTDSAILFTPLRTLPAHVDTLSAAISKLSWRFLHILVVFETFSSSVYLHGRNDNNGPSLNPFSPPVVKAVKKVKRHLAISEACEDKRAAARVYTAFPLNVDMIARVVRMFGDMACTRDATDGLLWGDRLWLDLDDEDSDEQDLAAIDGMNVFAAAIVLSTCSLDEFLDKTPQARQGEFGPVVGIERIGMFNRIIARRIEAMQLPSSSPPTTSVATSNPIVPLEDAREDLVEENSPNWVHT